MRIVELEMPLVIKFEQSWAVGVPLLQVDVVNFWLLGRVAAVFTHVNLEKVKIKSQNHYILIQTLTLDLRCL